MLIAGQKDMQQMDQYTMGTLGLPGVALMENAGARVVEEIIASAPCENPRVLVLAGGGNNGGDGFVIARRLCDLGIDTQLFLVAAPDRIKGDAKLHYDVYCRRGLPIRIFQKETLENLQKEIHQADIIVDAILGTGVTGPVKEPFRTVISAVNVNAGKKLIISVDIPSGVNSDNGKVEGVAIQATKTVSFVFPKKGFFLQDGPNYVGEWKAVDISVPPSIAIELGLALPKLITADLIKSALPARLKNGHKGTFGHVLVLGGSRSFVGAPIFSAKAAFHGGAGLVSLAVPESIYPIVAAQNPELLFLPLAEEDGHFSERAIEEISPLLHQFKSVAIGPGMSRFPNGEQWMKLLMSLLDEQTLIVDADAFYLLRNDLELVRHYKGKVIFTPHPGEMARLVGKTVKEVEEDRLEIARKFAKENNLYLLLKGHRTVIATPDEEIFINPYGHDALGKGGSGDVLTGLIASFVAQGATPKQAMIAASYLHARAGEEKAKSLSSYGVLPLDIIDGIREQLLLVQ